MKKSTLVIIIIMAALAVSVTALAAANRNAAPDTVSDGSLRVYKENATLKQYTLDDLKAFPSIGIEKTISSGKHEDESGTFTGIPLETLLADADPDWHEKYTEFIFHASDGFAASVFRSDVEKGENVIVVYEKDGAPLPGPEEGGNGPLRIVVADDPFGNRSAYLLTAVEAK